MYIRVYVYIYTSKYRLFANLIDMCIYIYIYKFHFFPIVKYGKPHCKQQTLSANQASTFVFLFAGSFASSFAAALRFASTTLFFAATSFESIIAPPHSHVTFSSSPSSHRLCDDCNGS